MKEYHVAVEVFVVVQLSDDSTPDDAENAVTDWLTETCPFEEMEMETIDVSPCTADQELARMRNVQNN